MGLAAAQGADTGPAINISSIAGTPRLDMRGSRRLSIATGVEEYVQGAGLPGELQLSRITFAHIELRIAELALELRSACADDASQPGSAHDLRRARGCGPGDGAARRNGWVLS